MKLNELEKEIIKNFMKIKGVKLDCDDSYFEDIKVTDRRNSGVGFFVDLELTEKLKCENEGKSYSGGEIGAVINSAIDTGYLIYVEEGYIRTIEGYTFEEEWPDNITDIEPYLIDFNTGDKVKIV